MRRIWVLVLLAIVGFLPLGCGSSSNPTTSATTPSSSAPTYTYPFLYNIGYYYDTCCSPSNGGFYDITGIAVSGGKIFVGDDYYDDIQVFDLNGNFITYFLPYNSYSGNYIEPEGMAADNYGNLYVADPYNDVIDIFNVSALSATSVPTDSDLYTYNYINGDCAPVGVALDAQGTLYITDSGCHEIYKLYQDSVTYCCNGEIGAQTSSGSASINGGLLSTSEGPFGIAVDPSGRHVYVADSGNNVIQIYDNNLVSTGFIGDPAGAASTATGSFNYPRDVHLDNDGNLLVADEDNSRIEKFSPGGAYLASFGNTAPSFNEGELSSPYYIAVDPSNNVFVTDNNMGNVYKFAPR